MFLGKTNIKPFGTILFFLVLMQSCKSTKTVVGGDADPSLSVKKIVEAHYDNSLHFNTLVGKVKIDYENGEANQGFSVSLRMKKDEVIWMSATLGVVKARITPEKVEFYNRLDNEYFEGDFEYLSNLLGTELNFEKVQSLLIGDAVLDLREEKYVANVQDGKYTLKPKAAKKLFKILFSLEPKNYRIASQEISQPWENRFLTMDYSYQEIGGKVLPDKIEINAVAKGESSQIGLEYRHMEFDRTTGFPYKVPKGFKRIEL